MTKMETDKQETRWDWCKNHRPSNARQSIGVNQSILERSDEGLIMRVGDESFGMARRIGTDEYGIKSEDVARQGKENRSQLLPGK